MAAALYGLKLLVNEKRGYKWYQVGEHLHAAFHDVLEEPRTKDVERDSEVWARKTFKRHQGFFETATWQEKVTLMEIRRNILDVGQAKPMYDRPRTGRGAKRRYL